MKYFIIIVLVSILCSEAAAQEWVQTGGPGGDPIRTILFNKKKDIFVLASQAIRSTDNGASWKMIIVPGNGLPNFIIAPNDDLYTIVDSFTFQYTLFIFR